MSVRSTTTFVLLGISSKARGATRAEIPYALAEINWKSVGNHGNLARNQKSGP